MAYFVMKNLQLNFEIMNNLKGAFMNDKEKSDCSLASKIYKKHINALKEEFRENGFELFRIMSFSSFEWDYTKNQDKANDTK